MWPYLIEYATVTKCVSCMTLPSMQDNDFHHRTLSLTLQDHLSTNSVCGGFIHKWWTLSCYQLNKPSLRISTLSVETCEISTEVDGFRIGQSRKWTSPPWQSWPRLSRLARYTIRWISWKTQFHQFYSLDVSPNDYSLFHFLDNNPGKYLPNEEDLQ